MCDKGEAAPNWDETFRHGMGTDIDKQLNDQTSPVQSSPVLCHVCFTTVTTNVLFSGFGFRNDVLLAR